MIRFTKSMAGAAAGLATLMLVPAPGFAAADQNGARDAAPMQSVAEGVRLAHMGGGSDRGPNMMVPGQGYEPGYGASPCQGYAPGSGMMGRGMMGRGMMAPGIGGEGMMGPNFGNAPGFGNYVVPSKDLTAEDVRHFLEHRLEMRDNKRLMVGEVKETDDNKIVAGITTVDGSLVQRLEVDRHTGQMRNVE